MKIKNIIAISVLILLSLLMASILVALWQKEKFAEVFICDYFAKQFVVHECSVQELSTKILVIPKLSIAIPTEGASYRVTAHDLKLNYALSDYKTVLFKSLAANDLELKNDSLTINVANPLLNLNLPLSVDNLRSINGEFDLSFTDGAIVTPNFLLENIQGTISKRLDPSALARDLPYKIKLDLDKRSEFEYSAEFLKAALKVISENLTFEAVVTHEESLIGFQGTLLAKDISANNKEYQANIASLELTFENFSSPIKEFSPKGNLRLQLNDASIISADYLVSEINSQAEFLLSSGPINIRSLKPIKISAQNARLGIEMLKPSLNIQVNSLNSIKIGMGEAEIFSGKLKFGEFSAIKSSKCQNVQVTLEGIHLEELAKLYQSADFYASGVFDGTLPVSICDNGISIIAGTLEARPGGGIIRYQGQALPKQIGQAQIALVSTILDNFHYENLQATVTYTPDGKLMLATNISGRNPDMSPSRPVNLALSIEENVLALIKSLRVTQDITKGIDSKFQGQRN